jgi:hypothetical protein
MPPGATRFCGRHEWEGQVAYASQFESPIYRALRGKAKIEERLWGFCDMEFWHFPPKPKWMRWRTYNRLEQKFDGYEMVWTSTSLRYWPAAAKRDFDSRSRNVRL